MALLQITPRQKVGSRDARKLRRQGLVPGVIYGHGEKTIAVTVPRHDIEVAVRHGERLVKCVLEGAEQNFLVKDVQYDHLGQNILHVDLARVSLDERVQVTVPVLLRGTPAGVETEDGVLVQNLRQLTVECLVTAIPEDIRVAVSHLHLNDVMRVSDLKLPGGVTAMDPPDTVVALVTMVAEEVEAPAEEAAVAEPEVIGAKPEEQPEDQEEEEKPAREKDKEKEQDRS